MLTFNPDLKPSQIKTYIERNADLIDGATGYTEEYGWGRINVLRTVQAVKADRDANRAPASDYTNGAAITMSVLTASGELAPFRYPFGSAVYLYQCDEAGKITNYVSTGVAGESWTYWDPEVDGNSPPLGDVAYFPMLRPGHYVAKARLNAYDPSISANLSEDITTPVFQIRAGEPVKDVSLVLKNIKIIYIQTYPTSDPIRGNIADTKIELILERPGIPFLGVPARPEVVARSTDWFYYDVLNLFPMPTQPGSYWIRVYAFVGDVIDDYTGETYYVDGRGEYALHVTNDPGNWQPSPAPLSYSQARGGAFEGSKAQVWGANSQLIQFDTVYYGNLSDSNWEPVDERNGGDWYRYVRQ
jgi:hypothetical protein